MLQPNDDQVKPPRRYRSPLRAEQARETRLRIVTAARDLFLQRGYAATSVEAIAAEAGIAVQTVYSAFGTKRTILARVMDLAIGGDDRPVTTMEREGPQRMREEPDQRRQLGLLAHIASAILVRAGALFTVVRAAAAVDPEIAARDARLQQERLENMQRMLGWVAEHGPLRDGLDLSRAADIAWTLTSADVHRLLTTERGWSSEQYEAWLGDTLIDALLP